MALFTKCILKPPDAADGIRISVMSRHTLPDGVTPDPRIIHFDLHMPLLGPSPQLIGSYYRRGLPWNEFEMGYLSELRQDKKSLAIQLIANLALTHDVTILCIEDTCEYCHRRLLADACQACEPRLAVEHR